MAMNQLQSELLRTLALGKNNQNSIIQRLDAVILDFGSRQVKKWRNSVNDKKNSLLHELVDKGLADVVGSVVEKYDFDINIKRESDGCTPFQLAAEKQDSEMCDLLKELGADTHLTVDVSKLLLDEDKGRSMNIVWVDLEFTSIENPEIMECAVIITDKDLQELDRGNWVIHFDQSVLENLGKWHQDTFADQDKGGNGLFADVLKSRLTTNRVEDELLTLIKRHCPEKMCPLAGSSIHIDKDALKRSMPKVHDYLHYRIIDVSSFQAIMRRWAPWMETKIKRQLATNGQEIVNHRAMDDIIWSISFMREFRPILTRQRNDVHNRKNEPPIQHHRKRSVSPSLVARSLPTPGNNHVENKMQLYADEKRLLERLEHEKTFNVKILKLTKPEQQMYNENPHLREVFINNQTITIYPKDFTIENRLLKLSSKRLDNNNSYSGKISTTEHWGQRKLLLTEIEFLTNYGADGRYLVVYAGAAPGTYINYLSLLFPHLEFVLIDTNDFSVTPTNKIQIRAEKFTDHLAQHYSSWSPNILFICNVRTFNSSGHIDNNLMEDMYNQMEWHKLMKPRASLLNFRLPRTPGKFQYLKGDLVIEPWSSKRSTECRLIVYKDTKLIEYDYSEFEYALHHFHNDKRIRFYKHDMDVVENEGLDHCYDCRAEIFILQEYLNKSKKFKNGTDLLKETAIMSSEISKQIEDKRRKQIIGIVRTLAVIPKRLMIASSNV